MEPTQERPLQPSGPAPAPSSSQARKIPIEPQRMQAIKEAFEHYNNASNESNAWALYRLTVARQFDQTALDAMSLRLGVPSMLDGFDMIDWLLRKKMIHQKVDELNGFIENNFREQEPDEAVQPSPSDVQNKAERREAIQAAYQEYMDIDPANPDDKMAAYNTFVDKVNNQMTEQEVKSIVLAYGARPTISNFKEFTQWLELQAPNGSVTGMLHGKDPASVQRMMDTIFPKTKL